MHCRILSWGLVANNKLLSIQPLQLSGLLPHSQGLPRSHVQYRQPCRHLSWEPNPASECVLCSELKTRWEWRASVLQSYWPQKIYFQFENDLYIQVQLQRKSGGTNWHKMEVSRHAQFSPIISRASDHSVKSLTLRPQFHRLSPISALPQYALTFNRPTQEESETPTSWSHPTRRGSFFFFLPCNLFKDNTASYVKLTTKPLNLFTCKNLTNCCSEH